MTAWLRISDAIDRFADRLGGLAGWAILLMVMIGSYNTVARYVDGWRGTHQSAEQAMEAGGEFFRFSSNAFLEAQWYLFSFVFLLGAAYTLRRNAHVRVDVLYGRLGAKGKAWIDVVGTLLMLVPFSIFCLWVSWPSVRNSWAIREQSQDPGGLARYPVKTLILIAFVLLLVQAVSELAKKVAILRGPDPVAVADAVAVADPVAAADPVASGGKGPSDASAADSADGDAHRETPQGQGS